MKSYLYILRSKVDEGYYVGITQNPAERLNYHNAGRVRSTRARIPFEIIYIEEYSSMSDARIREKHLKSYKGAKEKLDIIDNIVIK